MLEKMLFDYSDWKQMSASTDGASVHGHTYHLVKS